MDYGFTLKKIISSQYLYTGLRSTAAAIIPAVVLYHYGLLSIMSAVPLGALVVSLTDSPGPFHHRRNTILASICINFLVVVVAISLHHNPFLITGGIILFGMFFSLLGVYGNRVNAIGLIALLVFIFNIDSKASLGSPWLNGLLFTAGGAWYFVLSLFLHTLRPFRYIQQQLGENIREIAASMHPLAQLFRSDPDYETLYEQLRKHQAIIQEQQDSLREILLRTREMMIDSTAKGRSLMMMFLDSIDLFENLLVLQEDYAQLHAAFDDSDILSRVSSVIEFFSKEINSIGLSVQFNQASHAGADIDKVLQQLQQHFSEERKKKLNKSTIALFIQLRQIVFALQDIGERIKRLHRFTRYEKISREYRPDIDAEAVNGSTEISPALLLQNLSFKSTQFRHAVRITLAMLTGYIISLFFPLGHSYWILLTIVTILKPAYSISRSRNKQRLFGTLTGAVIGFTFLYFIPNNTIAFLVMLCAMIISYSLLKLNYYISTACITIYVLISIHFLNNSDFTAVVQDRAIDTLIGCAIASIISLTVLPVWEHEQTEGLILAALKANRDYFDTVANVLTMKTSHEKEYRLSRKQAFVALANLSNNFQRMLSEPKNRQEGLSYYHQFVSSSYMLTAHIAALATFGERSKKFYMATELEPLVANVKERFKRAFNVINHKENKPLTRNRDSPVINKVQSLLQQRQQEIETGDRDAQTEVRKALPALKIITDEFEMIDSIVGDEIKILKKIAGKKDQ